MKDIAKLQQIINNGVTPNFEDIVISFLKTENASRISSLQSELSKLLNERINIYDYNNTIIYERACYLYTYLNEKMFNTPEATAAAKQCQINNAKQIIYTLCQLPNGQTRPMPELDIPSNNNR